MKGKHRFERPFLMPRVACVCGERFTAPSDMGTVRQRDACLDWFSAHLERVRAAYRAVYRAAKK